MNRWRWRTSSVTSRVSSCLATARSPATHYGRTMNQSRYEAAMSRRTLLGRLAAAGASYIGLTAFGKLGEETARAPKWDDSYELAVDFEIAQPNAGRYHRPYVAVWVEDSSGKAV